MESTVNFTIEGVLTDAARLLNENYRAYGNAASYYKRAAVNAAHKLNREVSEYEVIMHELSLAEARIAMHRMDYSSYVQSVLLMGIAAQFCVPGTSKNYETTLHTDMTEAVKEAINPPVDIVPEIEQEVKGKSEE